MYFSSPTYRIDGVSAGTNNIDCRRVHLESMGPISKWEMRQAHALSTASYHIDIRHINSKGESF